MSPVNNSRLSHLTTTTHINKDLPLSPIDKKDKVKNSPSPSKVKFATQNKSSTRSVGSGASDRLSDSEDQDLVAKNI